MSDEALKMLIACGALAFGLLMLCVFASANGNSNFQVLVDAWKDKKLAEIELKKIQAQHERVCPRLTDKPRGT